MVLLHKKGNTSDIKNNRPTSLLSIIYKVFSHILLQQILQTLDFHQSQEQAGSRSGFSMTDHLYVINQLQEKVHEYSIPLCRAFRDYEKAFDSIKFEPIFHAVKNHGVNRAYLDIIKHLYHKATSVIHLHTDSEKYRLQRGVRQGDNISPRLFTSCLQDNIIGKINWKDRFQDQWWIPVSHHLCRWHSSDCWIDLRAAKDGTRHLWNQQTSRSQNAPGKD